MGWASQERGTSIIDINAANPKYAATSRLDELRKTEYSYLDRRGHIYLDYTGAGLAATSQLQAHSVRLSEGCYGNPHSENPTSTASTRLVAEARTAVLRFFNTTADEYGVVFTPNATGACRLVGESYPFGWRNRFVHTADNHNSVNGTGVQHPLDWVACAQDAGYDVLLDAAAFAPANKLDLSAVRPEFVSVSWYKVFGYPTGVGCLLFRRDALPRLRRPWFSGGTIWGVSVQGGWHRLLDDEGAFEDGTVNFLSIPDVTVGIDWISGIGIDLIHQRVSMLTGSLLDSLGKLKHGNGAPLIRLYGPATILARGGTVAFNFLDPAGRIVDERAVGRDASAAGISLRTGCFCNPGAGEWAFGLSRRDVRGPWWSALLVGGFSCQTVTTVDDYLDRIGLPTGGAVRVSFGLASNLADVEAFLDFAERGYRDKSADLVGLAQRLHC
jgi:selenocysteine lyase/cysteine desulfurase